MDGEDINTYEIGDTIQVSNETYKKPVAQVGGYEFKWSHEAKSTGFHYWRCINRHHRPRAMVSSVVCNGTARIVYNAASGMLKGSVVDSSDNNFAVNGVLHQPFSVDEPSTSLADFFVTDGDTGEQYTVLNIPVEWLPIVNVVTKATHYHLRISHPTIRFETKELLIGNRADLEIQQHLGAIVEREAGAKPSVHLGPMSIKIVASQRIEPGFRRESICDTCTVPIVEQSEDFLV